MEVFNLNTLLFAGKWAFIALVYFILIVLVIAVRREMLSRTTTPGASRARAQQTSAGSLRVLRAGSEPRLRPGVMLPLKIETSLGAEPENDLVLGDRYVSARHAILQWDGAFWWVEDQGSTNGTQVDGRPCPPHQPQPVPPGARLSVGGMEFELVVS